MHKSWRPIITRLNAGESVEAILPELYFGCEIEFADAGELGNGSADCPYDEDDAAQNLNDDATETLVRHLPSSDHSRLCYDIARGILRNCDLETAIDNCTSYSWSDLVDAELDSMRENWEPDDDDGSFADVDGWSNKEEGTSGIIREYVTDHPCNFLEMETRVNRLFDYAGDVDVPLNGSCHVHVSLPGVKHQTHESDSSLHCCLLWELSQLIEEFPVCVQERINSQFEHFFRLNANPGEKFSAIHFHGGLGTIEFRLFGHCDNAEDVLQCVRLAGTAFLRGYHRFFSGAFDIQDRAEFRQEFKQHTLAGHPMPLDTIVTVMPHCKILSATCGSDDIAEPQDNAISIGHDQAIIDTLYSWTLVDGISEDVSADVWENPSDYVVRFRNGDTGRLTREDEHICLAGGAYAYGPSVSGFKVWSSIDTDQDIVAVCRVASFEQSTVLSSQDIVSAMSRCSGVVLAG